MSGDLIHPLWPASPEGTSRSHRRRLDQLERRKHGPWRNAGGPGQPPLDPGSAGITAVAGYVNDVGVRWRRRLGGGCEIQVAVDGGADGDIVVTLPTTYFVSGEGKIPLQGHDSSGAFRAFYVDTSTGDVVIGV